MPEFNSTINQLASKRRLLDRGNQCANMPLDKKCHDISFCALSLRSSRLTEGLASRMWKNLFSLVYSLNTHLFSQNILVASNISCIEIANESRLQLNFISKNDTEDRKFEFYQENWYFQFSNLHSVVHHFRTAVLYGIYFQRIYYFRFLSS